MPGNVVSVDGRENRTAGRDYVEVNVAPAALKSPLTGQQRKQLHVFVEEVAGECGIEAKSLWPRLHAEFGVCSVKAMTSDQYVSARELLGVYRREHRDQLACNRLIERIQCSAQCRSIGGDEIERYCAREFGQSDLGLLSRGELQKLLIFVEADDMPVPAVARLSLAELFAIYPSHAAALVIIGFLIGLIF